MSRSIVLAFLLTALGNAPLYADEHGGHGCQAELEVIKLAMEQDVELTDEQQQEIEPLHAQGQELCDNGQDEEAVEVLTEVKMKLGLVHEPGTMEAETMEAETMEAETVEAETMEAGEMEKGDSEGMSQ
jgi:hypothetical protein